MSEFYDSFSPALEPIINAHLGETFPALTMAVIHRGVLRLNAAWGWIDPETRAYPVQPDTLFDLASVSKLFTTSAFLSLVSESRVKLDDPLVNVIPEFGESGPRSLDGGQDPHTQIQLETPPSVLGQTAHPERVTFYHLLTHTAGLARWRDVFNAAGPAPVPPNQHDPIPRHERWARALHALCHYPFVGQPGEGCVRYSDLGLMLLGEATSRLYELPGMLDKVLRQRVFEPLHLESLTFNPLHNRRDRSTIAPTEEDAGWRRRRCWGEVHDENCCGVGGIAGHAGLFGTAYDIATFGQAWLETDPRLNIATDLIRNAIRGCEESDGVRRGLGWAVKPRQDAAAGNHFSAESYGHLGFTGTSLWIDPDRALVVACLTNRVYPGREKEGIHAFRRAIHDSICEVVDTLC